MLVQIEVPQSWITVLGEKEAKRALEQFLMETAPCTRCEGSGFIMSHQQDGLAPHNEEIGCPDCRATPWENPL